VRKPGVSTVQAGRVLDRESGASAISRRLVGLEEAAAMLGVSPWTVREMVWRGDLGRVRLPRVRRLLFDVLDLEALIARSKG
jgi:helix-turn-helix protein